MMHGFGDCSEPLVESARIIEDMVLRQMRSIVQEACKIADRRGSSMVDIEDFIFLLRRDKVKMHRLLKYLDLKELKSSMYKVANSDMSVVLPDVKHIDELNRTKRPWEIYLEGLDITGELCDDKLEVDHVKHSRRVRAEVVSKNLDEAQYIQYSKARNVSFVNRHRHKFSDWVVPDGDVIVSKQGYVILSYLAYETVAQIIDLAFLIRENQNKIYSDAVDRMNLNHCNPHTFKPYHHLKISMTKQISPSEINEALRRYLSPQLEVTGPFRRWSLRQPHLPFLTS
ncbi:transcription initiation protein SPT3 homolog isoform X2 [Belonocnema kinseyi]|nr:transcription initiation protein SPT3 homolog isoform X2 [Belonocnema kinseyi]